MTIIVTKHRYNLTAEGTCPVDDTHDVYDVEIVTEGDAVPVERLLQVLELSKETPQFQEELAFRIACTVAQLTQEGSDGKGINHGRPFVVRTVGVHSGVRVETEHRRT